MSVSIVANTFGDILNICENRGRIIGSVKENDRDLMKGYIQEYYMRICTERNWPWRSFDRSFNMSPAITTGTVAVTENSKIVTFTGLTVSTSHLGRSIRIDGTVELYRIIGVKVSTNQMYLESAYAGSDNALATFKLFAYEFPLPPDCDTINNIYIDQYGELLEMSLPEFNRVLAYDTMTPAIPFGYCRDGKTYINSHLPPLDEMLLDYDFLGGEINDQTERLRILPIEPSKITPIHLNYCKIVSALLNLEDKPMIPLDDRWVLVHFALYEWFSDKGQKTEAEKQLRDGKMILKEMRNECRKGQTKPKFVVNMARYSRQNDYNYDHDTMFRMSRALEY